MANKILSFKDFLNEGLASYQASSPGGAGGQVQPQMMDKKKPQPYMGLTLNPEQEAKIRNLIDTKYDNPRTEETEEAPDASWQSVNTAQQHAAEEEVEKLKAKQGMPTFTK